MQQTSGIRILNPVEGKTSCLCGQGAGVQTREN